MADSSHKSSAQIEAEINAKRHRLADTIDQIQNRLSVGQLVDEALDYAKGSGGKDFLANLGRTVQNNPLPIALVGAGVAWLMLRPNGPQLAQMDSDTAWDRKWDQHLTNNGRFHYEDEIGFAPVKGGMMRRMRHAKDEAGRYVSEFVDTAGTVFKAWSDEAGYRAGHFIDAAGRSFRGFTDEAGARITDFRDEAGQRLDNSRGWSSDNWQDTSEHVHDMAYAPVKGNAMRRVKRARDATGRHISEFADSAGTTFKAYSDEAGNRAGHFRDASGRMFRGFADDTGRRVTDFRDETGNLMGEASGWASDAWNSGYERMMGAGRQLGDAGRAVGAGARDLGRRGRYMAQSLGDGMADRTSQLQRAATDAGGQLQHQAGDLGRGLSDLFEEQPLVGGALAFGIGALLAAALPRTEQEDKLMGESSDALKAQAVEQAHEAYTEGRKQVGEAYDQVRERTAEAYENVKSDITQTTH